VEKEKIEEKKEEKEPIDVFMKGFVTIIICHWIFVTIICCLYALGVI
jgi:hypothetical protein